MQNEPTVEPNRQLVERARAGELGAFEQLVRIHERPLFGFLYHYCGNADLAEELAQATFVKAWQALSGFRGQASFKTWLYRIATNLSINRLTRTRPTTELPESLPAPERDQPETAWRAAQRDRLVQDALSRLPLDQRACLILATYDEMSYEDIARTQGKTVRAVDSLLVRARRNLRRYLEPARNLGQL